MTIEICGVNKIPNIQGGIVAKQTAPKWTEVVRTSSIWTDEDLHKIVKACGGAGINELDASKMLIRGNWSKEEIAVVLGHDDFAMLCYDNDPGMMTILIAQALDSGQFPEQFIKSRTIH